MKKIDLADLSVQIKQSIARAKSSPGFALHASESEGTHALVHQDQGGGVRMSAFDEGGLAISFCVFDRGDGSFDAERDLQSPEGHVWESIFKAPTVEPWEKKIRLWESWVELFEGLPMVRHEAYGDRPAKMKT